MAEMLADPDPHPWNKDYLATLTKTKATYVGFRMFPKVQLGITGKWL